MAKSKANRRRTPEHVLKLPDLQQSKSAVLNSLTSQSSQRTYDHAIRELLSEVGKKAFSSRFNDLAEDS
jgi:hypothetical protein